MWRVGRNGSRRIEIPVRLLGARNDRYQPVNAVFEFGVPFDGKYIGRTLDDLVWIRIIEGVAGSCLIFDDMALQGEPGSFEIANTTLSLATIDRVWKITRRLVSMRGSQNPSTNWTALNGTGRIDGDFGAIILQSTFRDDVTSNQTRVPGHLCADSPTALPLSAGVLQGN